MTDREYAFLKDQREARNMYCESFVDRKWTKTMERRRYDLQAIERMREAEDTERSEREIAVELSELSEEELSDVGPESDFKPNTSDSDDPAITAFGKKRRKLMPKKISYIGDDINTKYRHIRESVRKVRPEVFEAVDNLKSQHHMSESQAHAAVVVVGNKVFARKWKLHNESNVIDLDTMPESKCTRRAGKSIEAMALDEIVSEIMNSSEKSVVTYNDDGSKKQGIGSFSVQGITINGKFRSLPTVPVASESRENLAELKLLVLQMLETASGVSSKTLFEKLDFIITDQTAQSFEVERIVGNRLDAEHQPSHLFCNVHPSLMFNRVITKQWAELENIIEREKIYSTFLVNATTNHASVTEQALDCTTRLINHDFDHKQWNKSREFDAFISPKKNKSVSLKDERFNRLTLTCAVMLYHYDDVTSFLQKFEHVTNQLACIVRCFQDLDFLKVLYASGALIGLHLVEPFLSLTTSATTTYKVLIPAFKQLFRDLCETDPVKFLDVSTPALSFVSKERFQTTRYDDEVCNAIETVTSQHRDEVIKVIKMILPTLATGFQKQKGDIFEFGGYEDSDHALSKMDTQKLERAPIHNLDAKRSVGFVNYELKRRGAKELNAASSAQVKAKASDLIEARPSGSFKDYREIGTVKIPEILAAWNTRQSELMAQGLAEKEVSNLSVDKRRTSDLDKLKILGGPFTSIGEVDDYIANTDIQETVKSSRLYLEVRYARDTSLSIPKTSDIFHMKKDYKNLPLNTYASNLKVYLSKVGCKADVTMVDFNQALDTFIEQSIALNILGKSPLLWFKIATMTVLIMEHMNLS
ncbi:hypothetical protein SNE40_018117 [Patella caerulea]|uniref:Uncharacterized protein n=1 Tax=Patella caerulea TaxID=87958 RepID=A0AAN8PJE6_PATCE